jgi:hypothetical protein
MHTVGAPVYTMSSFCKAGLFISYTLLRQFYNLTLCLGSYPQRADKSLIECGIEHLIALCNCNSYY